MPIFEKNGPLDSIKEHLGVIFQTPPKMSSQNSCLGGVFPGEGKSRLGYVLKISGGLWYNTSIRVAPREAISIMFQCKSSHDLNQYKD